MNCLYISSIGVHCYMSSDICYMPRKPSPRWRLRIITRTGGIGLYSISENQGVLGGGAGSLLFICVGGVCMFVSYPWLAWNSLGRLNWPTVPGIKIYTTTLDYKRFSSGTLWCYSPISLLLPPCILEIQSMLQPPAE